MVPPPCPPKLWLNGRCGLPPSPFSQTVVITYRAAKWLMSGWPVMLLPKTFW